MDKIENINLSLPQSLESIDVPVQVGPSSFPNNIDQLKTIDYSSIPEDNILEQKLSRYYQLLSIISSNNATEKEISELQRIMLDVRNYVLTEEDFNLMADAVRTTQIYLKNAADANVNNYTAMTTAIKVLSDELNQWTQHLNNMIETLGQIPSIVSNQDYSFGPNQPTKAPDNYNPGDTYYWVDTNNNYTLKQAVVGEDLSVSNFTKTPLNSAEQNSMKKFTMASDIFKRKTIIATKEDFQSNQTTSGLNTTIDESYLDYTSEKDLILEELSIGNNFNEVSNVDDLIDGRFEYGLTPTSVTDNVSTSRNTYPEDLDYSYQEE